MKTKTKIRADRVRAAIEFDVKAQQKAVDCGLLEPDEVGLCSSSWGDREVGSTHCAVGALAIYYLVQNQTTADAVLRRLGKTGLPVHINGDARDLSEVANLDQRFRKFYGFGPHDVGRLVSLNDSLDTYETYDDADDELSYRDITDLERAEIVCAIAGVPELLAQINAD